MPRAEGATAPTGRTTTPGGVLGPVLVARRAELDLSRRQLAERAGLSYPFVSELERGRKLPSAASLVALARALELTPAQLLARTEATGTDAIAGPGADAAELVPGSVRPTGLPDLSDLTTLVRELVRDELASSAPAPKPEPALTVSELRDRAVDALRATLGEDIEADDDGDIPVRSGEVMVFVRALPDPLSVLVFAPLLVDVDATAALDDRLNEINAGVRFVRFCWVRRSVVADLELFAEPFVPEHLEPACRAVGTAAEEFLGELRSAFGGEPFLREASPGPPPVAPRGTAGYL